MSAKQGRPGRHFDGPMNPAVLSTLTWKSAEPKYPADNGRVLQHAFGPFSIVYPICGATLALHTIRKDPKVVERYERCPRCTLRITRTIIEEI